jgi:uracil-DNA glycosylase family 4
MIGEAPGQQEDHSGLPFQGRSGYILNQYFKYSHASFNYCLTNLVGCRPTDVGFRDQLINREPTEPEQTACRPRLDDLCKHFDFDGVIYIGKTATNYRTSLRRTLEIPHPAYILRMEFKLYSIKRAAQQLERYVNTFQKVEGANLH